MHNMKSIIVCDVDHRVLSIVQVMVRFLLLSDCNGQPRILMTP